MNLLLDTHMLLWWLDDSPVLPRNVLAAIRSRHNGVFVSAASTWEMAIKISRGKLRVAADIAEALESLDTVDLAISIPHSLAAGALPLHHADPFDRMLIAQAQIERLTLVTKDPVFERYDVSLLES